jgi:putative flippase GtrA
MKRYISESLMRYLVVGSAAFVAEYGSFYLLYEEAKKPLYLANSVSFGLGLLTSFILNRIWTFESKAQYSKKTSHQLSYYVILSLINLGLTNLLVAILKGQSVNPKYGKLVAMVITSLWNYISFKLIIFTHNESSRSKTRRT